MFDASPFDLPSGPNETQMVQIANAALSASMPPTTIATALPPSANVQVVNFEQFVSGITTTSDVQKTLAVEQAATPMLPSQLQ
jgi:hypothetical protein